jgi:hypothetical protein
MLVNLFWKDIFEFIFWENSISFNIWRNYAIFAAMRIFSFNFNYLKTIS